VHRLNNYFVIIMKV